MKKKDLDKELSSIQKKKHTNKRNGNSIMLILCICVLSAIAFTSASFAVKNNDNSKGIYNIKVDIENGYQDLYVKEVEAGAFSDVIDSGYPIGEINCSKGLLKYDVNTRTIYSDNVNSDIECKLTFDSDKHKGKINIDELNEIADNYGTSYYFDSKATNNYLKIDYLMFRIVRINGDGTFRLVLDASLDETSFGEGSYETSNISKVLNEWLVNNLSNVDYITEADYDTNLYNSLGTEFETGLVNLNGYSISKVGLLSVNELININGSNKIDKDSYLSGNYFTMNVTDEGSVWAVTSDGTIKTSSKSDSLRVRPVINIRLSDLMGTGTFDDPYIIGEE